MLISSSGLAGVTCVLFALSCGTVNVADTDASVDTDASRIDAADDNLPPSAFGLIDVSNNETEVDVLPTFSWTTSTDPDGDVVSYSLFIDANSNPEFEIASGINGTSFTLNERLPLK